MPRLRSTPRNASACVAIVPFDTHADFWPLSTYSSPSSVACRPYWMSGFVKYFVPGHQRVGAVARLGDRPAADVAPLPVLDERHDDLLHDLRVAGGSIANANGNDVTASAIARPALPQPISSFTMCDSSGPRRGAAHRLGEVAQVVALLVGLLEDVPHRRAFGDRLLGRHLVERDARRAASRRARTRGPAALTSFCSSVRFLFKIDVHGFTPAPPVRSLPAWVGHKDRRDTRYAEGLAPSAARGTRRESPPACPARRTARSTARRGAACRRSRGSSRCAEDLCGRQ